MNAQNNAGLLQGEEIITYWNREKNQVRSIGEYKTKGVLRIGSKIGSWKYYYPNGKLQEASNYYEGVLNGDYYSYYANGKLKIKVNDATAITWSEINPGASQTWVEIKPY